MEHFAKPVTALVCARSVCATLAGNLRECELEAPLPPLAFWPFFLRLMSFRGIESSNTSLCFSSRSCCKMPKALLSAPALVPVDE